MRITSEFFNFPNAQAVLLPGMYVTAEFAQAIDTAAILVPQAGVSRDAKGNATVWVVGPGNRAVQRVVVADRTQGQYWVVTQGLAPGEKVMFLLAVAASIVPEYEPCLMLSVSPVAAASMAF